VVPDFHFETVNDGLNTLSRSFGGVSRDRVHVRAHMSYKVCKCESVFLFAIREGLIRQVNKVRD